MTRKAPHHALKQPRTADSLASVDMATSDDTNAAIQECFNDLKLSNMAFSNSLTSPDASLAASRGIIFDPAIIAKALMQGCSREAIRSYINSFHRQTVTSNIDAIVKDSRLLAYAVNSNSAEMVQLLLDYGASIDFVDWKGIPLLARAVMQTKWTVRDTTEVVKVLLTNGADPNVIPKDMWKNYIEQPLPITLLSVEKVPAAETWCKPNHRIVLAEALYLTQRYLLWRASHIGRTTTRKKQAGSIHHIQLLSGLPSMIIGQHHACKLVSDAIFSKIIFPTFKPLVLAFAGPSGHGKTELAKQMGDLIKVPKLEIDCAQTRNEFALLGSSIGYYANEGGSQLNNFLTDNAGNRCVVFLDEFDKTTPEVREALLKVMDSGKRFIIAYRPRPI